MVEALERKGSLTDIELYNLLKEDYETLGFETFNQTLMNMEIKGNVYVSALMKGKRLVELKKAKS